MDVEGLTEIYLGVSRNRKTAGRSIIFRDWRENIGGILFFFIVWKCSVAIEYNRLKQTPEQIAYTGTGVDDRHVYF